MFRKLSMIVGLLIVGTMLLTACGGATPTEEAPAPVATEAPPAATEAPAAPMASEVEVFSWWVGGGEAAGLAAMQKVFEAEYPDIKFVNGAVAGGAGTNARAVLATRLGRRSAEFLAGARRTGDHRHLRGGQPDRAPG